MRIRPLHNQGDHRSHRWEVVTDDSERHTGSGSTGRVVCYSNETDFRGQVGSVEGARGPVGFVAARSGWVQALRGRSSVSLKTQSETPQVTFALTLQDSQARRQGYTFQIPFRATDAGQELRFEEAVAVKRGRIISAQLDSEDLVRVGVTVRRSLQEPNLRHGPIFPFQLRFGLE